MTAKATVQGIRTYVCSLGPPAATASGVLGSRLGAWPAWIAVSAWIGSGSDPLVQQESGIAEPFRQPSAASKPVAAIKPAR